VSKSTDGYFYHKEMKMPNCATLGEWLIIMSQFLKKRSAIMAERERVIFIQKNQLPSLKSTSLTFLAPLCRIHCSLFFLAQIIYESQPVS